MNKPSNVVLLIEDEPKIRRFLRAGFEIHGFSVLEAESAADGLKTATFNSPDLIVLDLALPDLHGTEVLERLRSWSNVPVIILSVVSSEDEKVRLLQAGADDYVVKPFGKEIWSGNQRDNIQYLRILVRKLRQKIETDPNDPRLLVTESGVGYRLQARLEAGAAE
jgi:DNA-binding response OmpR family regulator